MQRLSQLTARGDSISHTAVGRVAAPSVFAVPMFLWSQSRRRLIVERVGQGACAVSGAIGKLQN